MPMFFNKNRLLRLCDQFLSLFYPRICLICERELLEGEQHICLHCLSDMPKTNYHRIVDNPIEQLFYGKVRIEKASGYFFFHQQSDYRKLIHAIKYHNEKQAGYWLGKRYGEELKRDGCYSDIDLIVPVPLHKRKFQKRGYNQSERIATGIGLALKKEVRTDLLIRTKNNKSQTHKSIYDRWLNTQQSFIAQKSEFLTGKNILLVDDVITTGATLQACAIAIKAQAPDCKINIVSLAVTE